ncbi:MAG: hypothetical protein CMK59_06595 [Proteobacteria bacterium]|nr:hypothetical protein [Pseudomonadota bacterium]
MRLLSIGLSDIKNAKQAVTESAARMSSGSRVNHIGSDQVALSLSSKQEAHSTSLTKAGSNIQDGVSIAQTIEGSVSEIVNILVRARELAVQAANEVYDSDQRGATDIEFRAILEEVDQIATRSSYNGRNLMDGSINSMSLQVGKDNNADNRITIDLDDYNSRLSNIDVGGGLTLDDVRSGTTGGIDTATKAESQISRIDTALDAFTEMRTKLGSTINRLDSTLSNLMEEQISLEKSSSTIADVDYAKESSQMFRSQMQLQSSTAALKEVSSIYRSNLSLIT